MKLKLTLLPKVIIAIVLGIACSYFFPVWAVRVFATFSSLFSNFLGFIIPLLIIGLVAPGIADLGKGAGRLLLITALIAYGSTIFAGIFAYFSCRLAYPWFLTPSAGETTINASTTSISPYFEISIPPIMSVMSALVLAFILGISLAVIKGNTIKSVLGEFREVIILVIQKVIIPILPLFIFCIFLKLCAEGVFTSLLDDFLLVIVVIIVLHILLLLIQFAIAGAVTRKNPFRALKTMLPAYLTALGTQSSAATIPVTLAQVKKNGVNPDIADFTVPLCATIHLAGSTLKIVSCAFALSYMNGLPSGAGLYIGFIMMLGIVMIAAPGVPGGAIFASIGLISSMLGFDSNLSGLMIALYITMDSFGTACNVTGDGAIALIVNKIYNKTPAK